MKHLFIITLFIISALTACEKIVLGPDESNTPENNFELFWNDFDQHYGLFMARGLNWDSIYQVYHPQVTSQTTDEALWDIFSQMIEYLDDSHTFIFGFNDTTQYTSGSALNNQAETEFSLDLVKNKYIKDWTVLSEDEEDGAVYFAYGSLKDKDIGYIYLGAMDDTDPSQIDRIINDLGQHQAIILDVRNNEGGDDLFAERIAGAFANSEQLIYTVQERNGPKHDDFQEPKSFFTQPMGEQQFTKPVMVLTDRATISAGEIFLLHMNAFPQVTQIGDSTAGDFSDASMYRFLPNGWIYRYSHMMYLLPDGSSLDGIGHVPDVYIKNSKADISMGNDLVMERTITHLKDVHGIE